VKSTYYVARITIDRVDITTDDKPKTLSIHGMSASEVTTRTVTQLAELGAVKSDELQDLITKIGHHLALVDDIDVIDPQRQKNTR
jgi:hypothetical protein